MRGTGEAVARAADKATHRNAAPGWILYLVLFNTAHHLFDWDPHEWLAFIGRLPSLLQDAVSVVNSLTQLLAGAAALFATISMMRRRQRNERSTDS